MKPFETADIWLVGGLFHALRSPDWIKECLEGRKSHSYMSALVLPLRPVPG